MKHWRAIHQKGCYRYPLIKSCDHLVTFHRLALFTLNLNTILSVYLLKFDGQMHAALIRGETVVR
jgi:hypothetical protein